MSTSEAGVNQAQDTSMLTVKVASDVKQKLQEWAARNLSSMTTELNRSVRERAEREQAEKTVQTWDYRVGRMPA